MTSEANRCCILVPVGHQIEHECQRALIELERRGYTVRRGYGPAAIDQCRSVMASEALRDDFRELFWIDSDIIFDPDDVDRLRASPHSIVCGIYPKKGGARACLSRDAADAADPVLVPMGE